TPMSSGISPLWPSARSGGFWMAVTAFRLSTGAAASGAWASAFSGAGGAGAAVSPLSASSFILLPDYREGVSFWMPRVQPPSIIEYCELPLREG
ncbi:MAG: hypothetical protein AAB721_01050, partial [Patescibacteria group bacterium]